MSNVFDLSGRTTIVTGAGMGIGREIARTLAQAGADIVIAELDPANGQEAATEMQTMGRESVFIQTDVCDPNSVEDMTQQVMDKFGKIDILVNNAGIVRNAPAESMSDADWLDVINVNLNGVFWCCRAVGKRMLESQSGVIVNIASMAGSIVVKPQPQVSYNAAKAGVILLTKSLAAEWAERGVRVNSVSPGYTGTELLKQAMSSGKELKKIWMEMSPMKRVAEPTEIAYAVWYLASDAATFTNGTDLVVDGAYTAW
jgi:NAD(P)-dependent dehydrogenase (short-subunit alcohol dehydrogenase family)